MTFFNWKIQAIVDQHSNVIHGETRNASQSMIKYSIHW